MTHIIDSKLIERTHILSGILVQGSDDFHLTCNGTIKLSKRYVIIWMCKCVTILDRFELHCHQPGFGGLAGGAELILSSNRKQWSKFNLLFVLISNHWTTTCTGALLLLSVIIKERKWGTDKSNNPTHSICSFYFHPEVAPLVYQQIIVNWNSLKLLRV